MKKGRERFENRGLWILLGVLCVVIVGLGVGIGVILSNSGEDSKDEVYGQTNLEASIADGYYPGGEVSPEAYKYNYDYLAGMIETGRTNDGQQLDDSQVLFLKIALVRLMVQYGKAQEAFDYLDNIDQNNLSNNEMMEVFALYSLIYQEMGDEEKSLMYANMTTDISNEIYNESGDEGQ